MLILWIYYELNMTSKIFEGHKWSLFEPWLTFVGTTFVLVFMVSHTLSDLFTKIIFSYVWCHQLSLTTYHFYIDWQKHFYQAANKMIARLNLIPTETDESANNIDEDDLAQVDIDIDRCWLRYINRWIDGYLLI